jgi:hypothetical protein
MANPSPQAIAKIRSRVGDWSRSDATIADALNAPDPAFPNPIGEPPTIPRPFTFADVMGRLSPESVANVRSLPTGVDIIDKINSQDRSGIAHWIAALSATPALISGVEASNVMDVITATDPDPNWNPNLSWAIVNIGRPVDGQDVAASRPGA